MVSATLNRLQLKSSRCVDFKHVICTFLFCYLEKYVFSAQMQSRRRHMLLICTAADSNVHIAYIKMQRCILYADMYIIYAEMCVIYEIYKHHL